MEWKRINDKKEGEKKKHNRRRKTRKKERIKRPENKMSGKYLEELALNTASKCVTRLIIYRILILIIR